jgi:phthalate 4,5-dioxygenase oxygenase subunit
MFTKEENEIITRVAVGTPMGMLMRRYWIPALLSTDLPKADCPPVRVKLLGERLVAIRDTVGRVGLLDEFCAHRGTSLFLGRNEEGGLRCVYHGWKYDVEGKCVDMPCETIETEFKDKIHLKAYHVVEMGDIIWTYMGPQEKTPSLPKFEWTQVPESHRHVGKTWEECNWLQALEGGLDTAHISFLHQGLPPVARTSDRAKQYRVRSQTPKIEVELTDYGFCYAGIRPLGEEGNYVRAYHYVMPFYKYHPDQVGKYNEVKDTRISGHIWVPMDDENTMVYNVTYRFGDVPLEDEEERARDAERVGELNTGFRKVRNKNNDWFINREIQNAETYTGIEGIYTQDQAVQESMGPIVDRTREHLGSIDKAIIAARLLLQRAVKTVQAGGEPPATGSNYYLVRAIEKVLPHGVRWQDAMKDELYPESTAA